MGAPVSVAERIGLQLAKVPFGKRLIASVLVSPIGIVLFFYATQAIAGGSFAAVGWVYLTTVAIVVVFGLPLSAILLRLEKTSAVSHMLAALGIVLAAHVAMLWSAGWQFDSIGYEFLWAYPFAIATSALAWAIARPDIHLLGLPGD